MAHTVIPPPRGPTATLELAHKGNINDKTIPERDREVRDFNVPMLASAIARRRNLVIDTHRTDLGVTRQGCHHIHEMIVTANKTCVLHASEDMITQRIDTHLAGAKRATVSPWDGCSETYKYIHFKTTFFWGTLLLYTTCVRSCCNWRANCVAEKKVEKKRDCTHVCAFLM